MARGRGAVVIGGYINGLGMVRALAARRIPVAVITTKPYDIAHRSRFVAQYESALEVEHRPEALIEILDRRARDWTGYALIPANDGALAALAHHHDRLWSLGYHVIAPHWDVARYFIDKSAMRDMANALGIDLPRCYGPATPAIAAQAEVQFPVVVKPVFGHSFFTRFGCKLFTARDRADLDRYISLTTQAGEPCEMFDLIPGPATSIFAYTTYIDSRGEPSGGLTIRKLRLSPAFAGVSRVAEIVPDIPVMRDATIAFARRAGFRGMTDTEFKLDPRDGSYRFLEVNGRSVLFNSLLRRGGLDLAALAWGDYVEEQPQRVHPSGWPGVWVNLHADLLYSLLRHRQERLSFSAFLAPYRRPVIDAVWSARDPLPFFAQWSRTAGEAACAVLRGRLGKTLADHTGSTYDP